MEEFEILIDCSFVVGVKAKSLEEAIKKMEDKYKYGKGRLPRDYRDFIEVYEYIPHVGYQIED